MNQEQREAILDLLSLSIFIDSHVSVEEDEALQKAIDSIGWESKRPRELFLFNSMNRARVASESDHGIEDYIAQKSDFFSAAEDRLEAIYTLKKMLVVDDMKSDEQTFFDRVQIHLL